MWNTPQDIQIILYVPSLELHPFPAAVSVGMCSASTQRHWSKMAFLSVSSFISWSMVRECLFIMRLNNFECSVLQIGRQMEAPCRGESPPLRVKNPLHYSYKTRGKPQCSGPPARSQSVTPGGETRGLQWFSSLFASQGQVTPNLQ